MEIVKTDQWIRPKQEDFAQIQARVRDMIEKIEAIGDPAIDAFSTKLDGFLPEVIELEPWETYRLKPMEKKQLSVAAQRIKKFCEFQKSMYRDMEMTDAYGRYGHRVVPVDRMAAYIPAGRFPLVSTTLMTLIPASVAGVKERVAVSPSSAPAILAAASLAGATRFWHLGGAQAIAAMALGYGLQVPVDIVVGPGNSYVTAAKAILQDRVNIDSLAGPSELLILADGTVSDQWLVYDLLAQAEHDPLALSIIASTSEDTLQRVRKGLEAELLGAENNALGTVDFVWAKSPSDLVAFSNRVAPEHLLLACEEDFVPIDALRHFGSLFIGGDSTVAFGDYCTGPNHTLPTAASARRQGGLHVGDFFRILTYQQLSGRDLSDLAETACTLANMEGLEYHRISMECRTKK